MAIIKNLIISIYGLPGSGKSFIASAIAWLYWACSGRKYGTRIWSNIDIYTPIDGGGKMKINKSIVELEDLEDIPYNDQKGLVIIDEGGLNVNARRSNTDANLEFAKLGILGRKKNVDIIIIAQLDIMVDKYFRMLSTFSLTMDSYFESKDKLMFTFRVTNRFGNIVGEKQFDLFEFSKRTGMTYDTKETSMIDRTKKKKGGNDQDDGGDFDLVDSTPQKPVRKKPRYLANEE